MILCKVIDHLHRERNVIVREQGEECREGLRKVVEELSKLRYEMSRSKPITPLIDSLDNAEIWNKYLEQRLEREGTAAWFSSSWMWVECYMYRRMAMALALTKIPQLQTFDFFRAQKEEGFHSSLPSMQLLGSWLMKTLDSNPDPATTWTTLLQVPSY